MMQKRSHYLWLSFLTVLFVSISALGQAPYRVNHQYEDTVRIAIIWNNPEGYDCSNASLHQPVGQKTRDFVLKALDISQVPNIRVLLNTTSDKVSWSEVENLWGASRLPHVIVHVNAGWSNGWNEGDLENTLKEAVRRKIGVVSVGDDAANLANETFGFNNVNNVPPPLGDALTIDSLWIGLQRSNDNRLKVYDRSGNLEYPGANGIISNTVDRILSGREVMQFLPRNKGRCQADADRYTVTRPDWLTMLGYQQGFLNGQAQPARGGDQDLNVLVAIQDTVQDPVRGPTIRRGVAVSFQPQFLANSVASQQIVYDAIMFASLAHTLSVPTSLIIQTEDDTITAGDIDSLKAFIIDQKGDTIKDPTVTSRITWDFISLRPGDRFVGNNYGETVRYTAEQAYRYVTIYAEYNNKGAIIRDTARIWVRPGPAHHLVIEGSSTPPDFGDNPIGGNSSITIGPAQTEARGFAVLRDRFTNRVSFSTVTRWDTLTPYGLITVRNGTAAIGEGIVTKRGNPGITYFRAVDLPTTFMDTVKVTIENTTYDSLRIMQFNIAQGRLERIYSLTMRTSDTTTLYVQGLRTDRIGPPGSGGWVDVPGNWNISINLRTNPTPPSGQNAWRFSPVDTGHGTISVRLTGTSPSASIPVVFTTGVPISLVLYPIKGNPGTTASHPQPPIVSDTVTAGAVYTKLYAKLFDSYSKWLSEYESDYTLSQQIKWSVTPVNEVTLSALTGYSTTFSSTRAYRLVLVKATLNNLSDSMYLYIKPDAAHHLVIEESAQIKDSINDDPLSALVIRSDQTLGYDYAILRDRFGNFVDYSKATKWLSLDTSVFKADKGLINLGEGVALRNSTVGSSKMVAIDTVKNFQDTVPVEVQNINYTKLRIYLLDNGPKYIDSIAVRTDEQIKLYVEGMRSDNQSWELVPANWSTTGNLKTKTQVPSDMVNNWIIIPDSVGTGWIKVTRGTAVPDSVYAVFLPGLPGKIAIYKEVGNPLVQHPYSTTKTDTIIAGIPTPLVAKVFDRNGIWLPAYENDATSKQLISWTIVKVNGVAPADSLKSRDGYINTFTPLNAYNTYTITARFKEGDKDPLTTQVTFTVIPGAAHHLVIEGTPNITGLALTDDQPLGSIDFGKKDTVKTAYAILRDINGNFVSHSTSTDWKSLDILIVKAEESVPQVGEGKVLRIGTINQTKVVATNRLNPLLRDTVDVVLSDFSYDSLRIVVDESTRIEKLTMRSDQDTTLKAQGLLSYNQQWVSVSGDWVYITSTGKTMNLLKSNFWDFAPGDTGHGKIILSMGSSVPDTIDVTVLPGLPSKLVLYGKEGPVDGSNPPYPNPTDTLIDSAGVPFPVVAKILDHKNVWLPEYELESNKSKQIHWAVQEMPGFDSTGKMDDSIGHARRFLPVKAYQSVYIISSLLYNQTIIRDTVLLKIVPNKPAQLVIEGSPNWKSSPNKPNPIDTVMVTDSMNNTSVYAVLRDSLGNYVNYANVSEWGVVNNDSIITIKKGNVNLGEGVIERKQMVGTAKVFAVDVIGFRDTTVVKLLPYHYTALRILSGNVVINSLTMNTNQDTTIRVQGLRSDTALWEDVDAKWETSTNLKTQPPAPGKAHLWFFSPSDTGTGWIRVTLGNDLVTKPDTIDAKFTIGPPTRVTIDIVTPKDQRIAGEPIIAVVTIYNQDGKVPGEYCFDMTQVRYSDILDPTGRPKPFVILNGKDTVYLSNLTDKQCFHNAVDTVDLRLFYATQNTDSLHQIIVNIGTIKAETPPFEVLPGKLDNIVLERDGKAVLDTLVLTYHDKDVMVVAIGYDKYGNRRGPETSNWSSDPTIPPIINPLKVSRILYDASGVIDNTSGVLKANSNDFPLISSKTVVKLTGPLAQVKTAITRDTDGDGLLDGIDLIFNKGVTLPQGFLFPGMTIQYNNTIFQIDSISGNHGQKDTIWHLVLKENVTEVPQTAWTPTISYAGFNPLQLESIINLKTTDGAGPVIWKVTKQINDIEDRKKDLITIEFSEPVVRVIDGSKPTSADAPYKMFYVWELNSEGKYVRVDSVLIGINNILSYNGTQLQFFTSNGVDISSRYFFSLTDSIPYLKDVNGGAGNTPVLNNRKSMVLIINTKNPPLYSVPNPAVPTFRRTGPGVFNIVHEMNARSWVRTDNGGTVITFPIVLPDGNEKDLIRLRCQVKIHDIAGNLVASKEHPNIFTTIPQGAIGNTTVYSIDLYWNGSNSEGMKVAPGIYKVVVTLDYSGDPKILKKYKDSRHVGLIGIGR